MLTPDDALTLAPEVAAFLRELVRDLAPDSDGGRKLTPEERHRLLSRAESLLGRLVVDILD